MRTFRSWLLIAAALVAAGGLASAQTTTGTISGHVADGQGLALPGVTINATSPNLQGVRTVVTSPNGDYIFTALPPGTYKITFELSGFQNQERNVNLAPTQALPLDATMGVAALNETITVVGRPADVLMQTAQVATNFKQDFIATLPTNRDLSAAVILAPTVHASGPSGSFSVAGSMSFENTFMVNGVNLNDNIRGTANTLYIEDAIQETNIMSGGVSAEYGRFSGGIVNAITKSGGNTFSGSLRDSLNNDNWRSTTPFPGDTKTDKTVPAYEYTLGGPVAKDHLWFFTAGRLQDQVSTNTTVAPTGLAYTFDNNQKRFEGKGTYSFNSNNTFVGTYSKILNSQTGDHFGNVLDLRSLDNRSLPQDLYTVNYNGILSPTFTIEGRYSARHFSFVGSGAPTTDLIQGTLVLDQARGGLRYWSPTFCGICDPEKRDNQEIFLKGSYFLSEKGGGSHNLVFGYDTFDDERFANNHQSGSDWRILGTTSLIRGTNVFPQFLGDGTTTQIQYNPILVGSEGTNFRTHSLFVNDNWRLNNNFTFNLGLRYDKNHGADSAGQLIAKDSALSPRLGFVWDPTGNQQWSITGSYAKYVAALANSIGDSSSAGGNPATFRWAYQGPDINPDPNAANLVTTDVALQQLFAWFNANGGQSRTLTATTIPGVSTKIPNGLDSPNVQEFALGINRQIGSRGAVRVDGQFRRYRDFYATVTDQSTGKVSNNLGQTFDLSVVQNTNAVHRQYEGVSTQATYRFSSRVDVGGNYTLSRAYGNFDGENTGSGPVTTGVLGYPEYKQLAWNSPDGDLLVDQRHQFHGWVNYGVPRLTGLTVSALELVASGVPYGAAGTIDARSFVTNPGYITPQGAATETYYFTARDAFRTQTSYRTDAAANYSYRLRGAGHNLEVFGQLQVLNVFNKFQLCGCGGNVFQNGGGVDLAGTIDTSVLSNATNATQFAKFNPFTTTPAQGANWALGPKFGQALTRFAYTSPRELRLSFGVRF